MTRIQRIKMVMSGGVPDRIPVMTHNFLMAAREAGVTMAEFRSSADVMAKTLISACQRYVLSGNLDPAMLNSAGPEQVRAETRTPPARISVPWWRPPSSSANGKCLTG